MAAKEESVDDSKTQRERKPNFSDVEISLILEGACEYINILNLPDPSGSVNLQKEAAYKRIADKVNAGAWFETQGKFSRDWKEVRQKWQVQKRAAVRLHKSTLAENGQYKNYGEEDPRTQLVLDILSGKAKVGVTDFRIRPDVYYYPDHSLAEEDGEGGCGHSQSVSGSHCLETKPCLGVDDLDVSKTKSKTEAAEDCVTSSRGRVSLEDSGLSELRVVKSEPDSDTDSSAGQFDMVNSHGTLKVSPEVSVSAKKRERKKNFTHQENLTLIREINEHKDILFNPNESHKQKTETWTQIVWTMSRFSGSCTKRTMEEIKIRWKKLKQSARKEKVSFETAKASGSVSELTLSPYTEQILAILDHVDGTYTDDGESVQLETAASDCGLNIDSMDLKVSSTQSSESTGAECESHTTHIMSAKEWQSLVSELDRFSDFLLTEGSQARKPGWHQAWRLISQTGDPHNTPNWQFRWTVKELRQKWLELERQKQNSPTSHSLTRTSCSVHAHSKVVTNDSINATHVSGNSADSTCNASLLGLDTVSAVDHTHNEVQNGKEDDDVVGIPLLDLEPKPAKIKRKRDANFTSRELQLMLRMYKANKEVLDSRKMDQLTNMKKVKVWQAIADRVNKCANVGSTIRTANQVRDKVKKYRLDMCRRRLTPDQAKINRGTNIMDTESTKSSVDTDQDVAIQIIDSGEDTEQSPTKETKDSSAVIQGHLDSLVRICNQLRSVGVEAAAMILEDQKVISCGSQKVRHVLLEPYLTNCTPEDQLQDTADWKFVTLATSTSITTSTTTIDSQSTVNSVAPDAHSSNISAVNYSSAIPAPGSLSRSRSPSESSQPGLQSCHGHDDDISLGSAGGEDRNEEGSMESVSVMDVGFPVLDDNLLLTNDSVDLLAKPDISHNSHSSEALSNKQDLMDVLSQSVPDSQCLLDGQGALEEAKQAVSTVDLNPGPLPVTEGGQTTMSFYCSLCSAVFPHLFLLMEHKQSHAAKDKTLDLNTDAGIHTTNNCNDNGFAECAVDQGHKDQVQSSEDATQKPGMTLLPDNGQRGRHVCRFCGKRFLIASLLIKHVRTHSGQKPFMCDMCGSCFTQSGNLRIHRRKHTGDRPYVCDLCGKAFYRACDVRCHKRKAHRMDAEAKNKAKQRAPHHDKWRCDDCGQEFTTRSRLATHRLVHSEKMPFTCDICKKGFARADRLGRHRVRHYGLKRWQCDVCGDKFTENGYLKVHMRLHSGEKPFTCEFCGKGFIVTSALKVHRRNHTGERPFKCDICEATFKTGSSMRSHRRRHTGERPYTCSDCDEAFRDKQQLNVHRRIHTGIQPYTCKHCGKFFTSASHLTYHTRLHTGEKPYSCEVCGEKFHRSDVMGLHKRTKHAGVTEPPKTT